MDFPFPAQKSQFPRHDKNGGRRNIQKAGRHEPSRKISCLPYKSDSFAGADYGHGIDPSDGEHGHAAARRDDRRRDRW